VVPSSSCINLYIYFRLVGRDLGGHRHGRVQMGKGNATNLKVGGSMHWKVGGQYSKTIKKSGGCMIAPAPMVAPPLRMEGW